MKTRKHHNNKGYRQIKNGATVKQAQRMAKKLGVGKPEIIRPALLAYANGEISIGKLIECCEAWKHDEPFALPDNMDDTLR